MGASNVTEAALPLLDGEELGEFFNALMGALKDALGGLEWWVRGVYGDFVIVKVEEETEAGESYWTERIEFSRTEDGEIVIGSRQRVIVRQQVVFEPVAEDQTRLDLYRLRNALATVREEDTERRADLERRADAALAAGVEGAEFILAGVLEALREGREVSEFYSVAVLNP